MAKQIDKLTDLAIKAAITTAKAGEQTVKIRKLADGAGLYLWISKEGEEVSARWRLRYFMAGKEKLLSLGVYPAVGLADARRKCAGYNTGKGREAVRVEGVREQLQRGIDPSAQRKAEKREAKLAAANSFEAVAREWLKVRAKEWSPRHTKAVGNLLEADLFPDLGERPIAQITPLELLETVRKVEKRGATDTAHRALRWAGKVFGYAIAHGKCSRDIAADLKGADALVKHKVVNQAAVGGKELCKLLHDIEGYGGERQTVLALQLLALTFVRTSELINATWDEFDLDAATWVIGASRMKMDRDHLVPLSRQALGLLAEVKKLAGTSDFVFPGRNSHKPISVNTMLFALYRLGYKGKQTGHGFRAIASTVLNEVSPWKELPDRIEMQLAHFSKSVRTTYNRAAYWDDRVEMMQWWADYLDDVRKGAKVLPFGPVGKAA